MPFVVLLTLLGVSSTALACPATPGSLRPDAPIPAIALPWIAATGQACPALPASWIAAIIAQESAFHPDAHADDANGGTWGLFQINAGIWQATYGHPWNADLNHNGVWDVKDPLIHARVAGSYLCHRLDGVRAIRAAHPDWASTRQLTDLEALALAHEAGESALASYPAIPPVSVQYLQHLDERVAAWTVPTGGPAGGAGCGTAPSGPLAHAALAWALSHLGDAYVLGAHGPHAWDCSTFTYTAYRTAGLDWPMQIASGQYLDRTHVQLIPLDQARPGDLIFFETGFGAWWVNPVTHVGLIVDPAKGTMVHAANPDVGVVLSNYKTSPYYQAHPPVAAPGPDGRPQPGGTPVAGRIIDPSAAAAAGSVAASVAGSLPSPAAVPR